MAVLKGVDVSRHQGVIDWKKVKAAGIEFAVIRAGYGRYDTQIDSQFKANIEGAKAAGIKYIGVYWYSYAVTAAEGAVEADVCLRAIEPYREIITLPVFFDQEYEPKIKALTDRVRTDICKAFIEKVEKAGHKPGLYASYDWYMNYVIRSELQQYPVWIAQYAADCSYKGENLWGWQYTSEGKVNGVSGRVDLNEGYFKAEGVWKKNAKGWWYEFPDGSYLKNEWEAIKGYWYWFDEKGYAVTGAWKIDGKPYYFLTKEDADRLGVPECACFEVSKG